MGKMRGKLTNRTILIIGKKGKREEYTGRRNVGGGNFYRSNSREY